MVKETKKMSTKVRAVLMALGLATAGLGGAALGATLMPREVEVEVPVIVPEPFEVVKVINNTEVVTEVEKVENPLNPLLMEYIQDNVDEGLTLDYIMFEDMVKSDAEVFVMDNMVNLLVDEEEFRWGALQDYRRSEVSVRRILDPLVISNEDIDRNSLDVTFKVRMRARDRYSDAEYFDYEVTVPYFKGEMVSEDIEVQLI